MIGSILKDASLSEEKHSPTFQLELTLYQTELERLRYLLRTYLRIRLLKVYLPLLAEL